ncbi:MAG: hypothetical protein ACTSQO_10790 [Candidatus Helarchaeota archaeon]
MPIGLALIGWTNKTGFYSMYQYPNTVITEEEVMRIGSVHRMRYLEPSFITLNLKKFKVASFYSGMKTSRWVVEPNYVISLILDLSENAEAYSEILPIASLKILESIKTGFYQNVMAGVYEDINLGRVIVKKEILQRIFPPKVEEKLDINKLKELQEKVQEQEGIIKMLQGLLEKKDAPLPDNIKNLAEIDMLKTRLKMKDEEIAGLKKKVSEAEMKVSRISLLEARVRTLTADIKEKNDYIKELKQKLSEVQPISTDISKNALESDQISRFKQIINEQNTLIQQLKNQIESGETDKAMIASITEGIDAKKGHSKYIGL